MDFYEKSDYINIMSISKRLFLLAAMLSTLVITSCSYNSDYDFEKLKADALAEGISMYNFNSTIVVEPAVETDKGLIFYPGALVHYESYLPLLVKCAKEGIKCFLIQMPQDLALFDVSAANRYLADFPEIKEWYLSGHSLGGAMSGLYLSDKAESFTGLVFLAAFSTSDISNSGLKVLSLYGENDQVLNKASYEKNKVNLPADSKHYMISGGNHGNFGCYGFQKGDGQASITADEQQEIAAHLIGKFVRGEEF